MADLETWELASVMQRERKKQAELEQRAERAERALLKTWARYDFNRNTEDCAVCDREQRMSPTAAFTHAEGCIIPAIEERYE